jgi:hypothetical protein
VVGWLQGYYLDEHAYAYLGSLLSPLRKDGDSQRRGFSFGATGCAAGAGCCHCADRAAGRAAQVGLRLRELWNTREQLGFRTRWPSLGTGTPTLIGANGSRPRRVSPGGQILSEETDRPLAPPALTVLDRRRIGPCVDAADNFPVRKHVEIVAASTAASAFLSRTQG